MPRPGLGDHHHHRVREGPAREVEEFEAVVEHRRVRAVRVDDREDVRDVGAEEIGPDHRLAGVHPVHVAAQRVDLAVVDEVAVGVGAFPAREGIGGKTGVHDGESRLKCWVREVEIEGLDLLGDEHALVDDRLRGEAREVEVVGRGLVLALKGLLGALAHDVEGALEGELVRAKEGARKGRPLADEKLADLGHDRARDRAEGGDVHGHVAPAQADETGLDDDSLELSLDHRPRGGVAGHEEHADAVLPCGLEIDAGFGGYLGEETVRNLREDARAVA